MCQHKIVYCIIAATFGVFMTMTQMYSTVAKKINTEGTEFVVGFMDSCSNPGILQLVIVNSRDNETAATVTATSPYNNFSTVISVNNSNTYLLSLPSTLVHTGNERSTKGVRVTSTLPVSVYGIHALSGAATGIDTYLALPNSVLDKDYIVLTYAVSTVHSDQGSQFLIIGVEDDTFVRLTVTASVLYAGISYSAGSNFFFTLNGLDSVHFQSQGDLTGSKIFSSKPLSLFSGNKCDNVPFDVLYADHMVSQIPPVNLWGNSYVTTPLAIRTAGDIFRVLASEDGTTVTISGLSSPIMLNSGQFYEIDVPSTQSWLITADAPIIVAQFCKGGSVDSTRADPFMMLLPSLDNFLSGTYGLAILDHPSSSQIPRYFINIVVDCSGKSQLSSSPPISVTWLNVTQHMGLCVGTAELSAGNYSLIHSEVKYHVLVYSLGAFFAYGHPLALQFDVEEDLSMHSTTVSWVTDSFNISTPTHFLTNNQSVEGGIETAIIAGAIIGIIVLIIFFIGLFIFLRKKNEHIYTVPNEENIYMTPYEVPMPKYEKPFSKRSTTTEGNFFEPNIYT